MTPNDDRYLSMSDEDIAVEYEAVLCSEGETRKTCPVCSHETYQKSCPRCPGDTPLSGDPVIDDLSRRLANGEQVDLEAELRKPLSDTFVPVIPGEIVTGNFR